MYKTGSVTRTSGGIFSRKLWLDDMNYSADLQHPTHKT